MKSQAALLNLAKRVQAIAENGLHYAESEWDQDRYKDLEQVAMEMLSVLSKQPLELVQSITPENNGYRTPKIDVRAVIFNEKHEILMVKERVDGRWSMPGGWCDVGLTPVEVVEKESLHICQRGMGHATNLNQKVADRKPWIIRAYLQFLWIR